jgi:hypothetical protein
MNVRLVCGYCLGVALKPWKTWGIEPRIFLSYDSSLEVEQTTMTPKPQTNFPESPAQLSFAGSGPSCLRSPLESSLRLSRRVRVGAGAGVWLSQTSALVAHRQEATFQSHSVVQSDLFTRCPQYLSSSVSLRKNFLQLPPSFSNLPNLT